MMTVKVVYRSSIPKAANERVVVSYANGAKKQAGYRLNRRKVGVRLFFESGEMSLEYSLKNGVLHGYLYEWAKPGKLTCAEPRRNGRIHGIARQWNEAGVLLGTYTFKNGTGWDIWRHEREDGSIYIAEAHPMKDGLPHGVELWLDEAQSLTSERYWDEGKLHGIERDWNARGGLRRGSPRFWVRGKRVNKRVYLKEQLTDGTLPPFRVQDNSPKRDLSKVMNNL